MNYSTVIALSGFYRLATGAFAFAEIFVNDQRVAVENRPGRYVDAECTYPLRRGDIVSSASRLDLIWLRDL